jgi:hypothetical protein
VSGSRLLYTETLPAESAGKRERQGCYFLCTFVITTQDYCSRRLIIEAQFLSMGIWFAFRLLALAPVRVSYGKKKFFGILMAKKNLFIRSEGRANSCSLAQNHIITLEIINA